MTNNIDTDTSKVDETKRFLKRYRKNKELIRRLEDKLISYEERLISLRSPVITDLPKGGIPTPKDEIIADKLETFERINRLKERGKVIRAEILEAIDTLDSARHADILEAFCIECKSFDEIAEDKGYSERRVIAIYTEAIRRLSNISNISN